MTDTKRLNLNDLMAIDLPEGQVGNVRVERFEVTANSLDNLRLGFEGRGCLPGTYTALMRGGTLWMSDTTAERRDHFGAGLAIREHGGRVLIGGLGLGMILRVALLTPTVTEIDVVEIDPDVIALVGRHYQQMAEDNDKRLTIHQADLYEIRWPPGTRWDVAWFDIWPELSTDDLAEMARLRRSYGRRTTWNDCWGRDELLRRRRVEQTQWWWRP